jgi:phosphopantetheinyl transferase
MLIPKPNQSVGFDSLPGKTLKLGYSLFPDSCLSIVTLPLSHINTKLKQLLHEEELLKLDTFTYEKRYTEWLGGRICSKQVLHNYLKKQNVLDMPFKHQQYKISSEESGRPFFSGTEGFDFSFPELSISHSKDFAAAMVSKTYCGIDIQYPAKGLVRVKERFVSDNEESLLRKLLPQLSTLQQLTMLWSGKEAVKKMLSPEGIPGFNELTLVNIIPHNTSNAVFNFSKAGKSSLPVAVGILDNGYGLAFCCEAIKSSNTM